MTDAEWKLTATELFIIYGYGMFNDVLQILIYLPSDKSFTSFFYIYLFDITYEWVFLFFDISLSAPCAGKIRLRYHLIVYKKKGK